MEYSDLTSMSRALATGFGDAPERMLELMTAIGDAGSAVGVDASGMTYMSQILSRVQSSNQFSKEDLDAFQDRGIDVLSMLSSSFGVAEGEIYDMISKGEINGRDAVNIIQQGMETAYSGAMKLMAETFSGLTSTLEDTMAELDNARGEGYNEERKEGLQSEIDAYGGALGEAIQNINRISGENEAYMDNLSDQYTREALSAVLLGEDATIFPEEQQAELRKLREEFLSASSAYEAGNEEAGLKMESLRQQAEALATLAYESSDQYQLLMDSEKDLIGAIRKLTASFDSYKNQYGLKQELSKGLIIGPWERTAKDEEEQAADTLALLRENPEAALGDVSLMIRDSGNGHAYGLDRVPRNGLYYLHQDERVLTARDAGELDRSGWTPSTAEQSVALAAEAAAPRGLMESGTGSLIDTSSTSIFSSTPTSPQVPGNDAYSMARASWDALDYLPTEERPRSALTEGEKNTAQTVLQITISNNHFGADMSVETVAQTLADLLERKIAAGVIG